MIVEGRALKYGGDVNTDVIYPGKYMVYTQPQEIARYAMAGLDPDFPKKIGEYGVMVAGRNFGCGSSREHAPLALKYAGARCLVAESFARIFYRNAVNTGLPLLECEGVTMGVEEGDHLTIDLAQGAVLNHRTGRRMEGKPLPPFLIGIFEAGGLIPYLNRQARGR